MKRPAEKKPMGIVAMKGGAEGEPLDLDELGWKWAVHYAQNGDAEYLMRLIKEAQLPQVARKYLVDVIRSFERGAPLIKRRRARLRRSEMFRIWVEVNNVRRLKLCRKDVGERVRELAARYNVTEATIRDIARGTRKLYSRVR